MAALIKHFLILSMLYCGIGIQCLVHAQSSIVVDQSNMGTDTDSNGASAPFSFGQSFTPELFGINTFEFLLGGANAISKVRIRDGLSGTDGLGAAVLAESTPTAIGVAGSNLSYFPQVGRRIWTQLGARVERAY